MQGISVLVGLLYWNYYLTVITDPGRVPKSWVCLSASRRHYHPHSFLQEPNTQSGDGYEVKRLTGTPRYCRMCNEYKPPRAHHCRQCRRCASRLSKPLHLPYAGSLGVYCVWVSVAANTSNQP